MTFNDDLKILVETGSIHSYDGDGYIQDSWICKTTGQISNGFETQIGMT